MSSVRALFIPSWTENVGAMANAGATVHACCDNCSNDKVVDLAALEAKHGPRFSLWGRRPRCHNNGCTGRVRFRATIGMHPFQMHSAPPSEYAYLHERWRAAWPKPKRAKYPLRPMIEATRGVLNVWCDRCKIDEDLSALEVGAGARRSPPSSSSSACSAALTVC